MNQRKPKARKATAKISRAEATPDKNAQALDAVRYVERAKARQEQEAERQKKKRQVYEAQRPKPVTRELSQIKFESQHWWHAEKYKQKRAETGLTIEEEKAAMWYEAARRRPEVQEAWREGKSLFGDNGWQAFSTLVVLNLPRSWPELNPIAKRGIIEASYSPWSVPPEGLSTFPTDKAEQRDVSIQVLHLPEPNESPDVAQRFVQRLRKFVDAGFLIVAVDKKQNQAVRAAFETIEELPPTFRAADLKEVMFHHLPPDLSEEDRQALVEKERQGTLTDQYVEQLQKKYIKPTSNLFAPWHKTAEVQERVFHKRERQGKLIEEKQFNFESICRQLEAFDNGCISEFVNSVRL